MPGLADLIHRAVGRAVAPEVIEARRQYVNEADDLQRAMGGDPPEPANAQQLMNAQVNARLDNLNPLNWEGNWNPEPVRIEPPPHIMYPPPIEFKVDLAPATIEKIANRVLELLEEREAE